MADKTKDSTPRVWYFGVRSKAEAGHYLHGPGLRSVGERQLPPDFPIRLSSLDGGMLPIGLPQTEGEGYLWHVPGWTVLTFWDRSGDGHGNSNSAFIVELGGCPFLTVESFARIAFPEIWDRFTFEVMEAS